MRKSTLFLSLGLVFSSAACFAPSLLAQDEGAKKSPMAELNELDTDGDGNISFAEFQTADGERFDLADADGDGSLSMDEFLASGSTRGDRPGRGDRPEHGNRPERDEIDADRVAEMQAKMAERMAELFIEIDRNGDELISKIEMQEANFLRLDRNNDGVLAGRELRQLARGPQGRQGQHAGRRPSRQGQSADI